MVATQRGQVARLMPTETDSKPRVWRQGGTDPRNAPMAVYNSGVEALRHAVWITERLVSLSEQHIAPTTREDDRLAVLEQQYALLSERQELITTAISTMERQIRLLQTQIDKLVDLMERIVPDRDDD